jgi:hypothetical protein
MLKQVLGKAHPVHQANIAKWQEGFFDHLLRADQSYGQKWRYVRDNPVRAGLVSSWEEWPWQGELVRIDRACTS